MSGIVFKQSYRSRNVQGTPGLNVRHLQYIATRPGAVYNQGCGFGLWGKLPGDDCIRIQTDLERAEQIVKERSEERTMYRVVISVGKEDAAQKGMYHRENWEQLVNDQISVIAKEMDIKSENFYWCASMHYAKNHPHVHILYWDNGTDPRQEAVPKNLFEKKADHIRAAFSKGLYHEEIMEQQKSQKEESKAMRLLIQSMCREANPERGLNAARLYSNGTVERLSQQMDELIKNIPAKGSLRYAYVPQSYKELVDQMVNACLEVPELKKEFESYEKCTQEISKLYSNGENASKANLENANSKLRKELANEVLNAVREVQLQIRTSSVTELGQFQNLAKKTVEEAVPYLESYHALRGLLPQNRIPVNCMESQIPGFHDKMNEVVRDVMEDARFRLELEGYALSASGIDLSSFKMDMDVKGQQEQTADGHRMFGKALDDEQWQSYQQSYREARRAVRAEIIAQVRQDAGWEREAVITGEVQMLCSMIHLIGQVVGMQRGSMSWKRLYSKDKSKAAKKDLQVTQPRDDWEQDY